MGNSKNLSIWKDFINYTMTVTTTTTTASTAITNDRKRGGFFLEGIVLGLSSSCPSSITCLPSQGIARTLDWESEVLASCTDSAINLLMTQFPHP